jgi:hypothetical protein
MWYNQNYKYRFAAVREDQQPNSCFLGVVGSYRNFADRLW